MRPAGLVSRAALLMLLTTMAQAQPPEVVRYTLEDFSVATPWVWQWGADNRCRTAGETEVVHSAPRAVAATWDYSEAKGFFACLMFDRPLVGQVQEIRAWIHATEGERGTPLALWLRDASGETFIQRVTVDWEGWRQVSFPLVGVGAGWVSGDGNGKQDRPLMLFGISIEYGGPATGRLVLDDVEVVTEATPREALALAPVTGVARNLFWEEQPRVELPLTNHSGTAVSGARCELVATDLYDGSEVWRDTVVFATVEGGATVRLRDTLEVPYGTFRVGWRLADDQGELATGSLDVGRLQGQVYENAGEAVRAHDRRWSIFGGVFGSIDPPTASGLGARWIRYENTTWDRYETAPGVWDLSGLAKGLEPYLAAGIEAIILQTLYQRPSFRDPELEDFAHAYAEAMRRTAEAGRGLVRCFELGNEDNGPTKGLYGEVARQAAAAVRSAQPGALVANSGTAFVDLGWLRMQAARGALDGVDALCTHPYTVHDSPEAWSILEKLESVNALIDELGGMKTQWTTEFGWEHTFDQAKRANWTPRHFLVGAAAGLERHGLYTWERDYGILQSSALPPAASLHALAKAVEGRHFVGLLRHDEETWAAVWSRAGMSVLFAWSPREDAHLDLAAGPGVQVTDLFGNRLGAKVQDGRLGLDLTGAPVIVTGLAEETVAEARASQVRKEQERLGRCLEAAALRADGALAGLATGTPGPQAVEAALLGWAAGEGEVGLAEQAVVAQGVRLLKAAWEGSAPEGRTPDSAALAAARARYREELAASVEGDVDLPSLRWLLERWDRLADEEAVARELMVRSEARRLLSQQRVLDALCGRFLRDGQRVSFGLCPYLHATAPGGGGGTTTAAASRGWKPLPLGSGGTLDETLRFVPGEGKEIRLRVSSFCGQARQVTARVEAPEGWQVEPAEVALEVDAGGVAEAPVRVTCPAEGAGERPALWAVAGSEGLPERRVRFDDVVIEAPVRVTCEPLAGLLPGTPLRLRLSNPGGATLAGLVRVLREGDDRALARGRFGDLAPGTEQTLELPVKALTPWVRHDWPLTAQFTLEDGRRVERPVTVDFACATKAPGKVEVDGELGEWRGASPLHLDREEYGKGSFGGRWSPEDLSATTYIMWDEETLYFAAVVRDQTFNQTLSGTSQWMQDSIQFALAREVEAARTELGLAHTAGGDEVVSYTGASSQVPGAELKVRLEQGQATYEAAIPWGAFAGLEAPQAGEQVRLAVLVNDDDAVTGRRFLERYGGIAHDKDVANFGYLTLLAGDGGNVEERAEGPVFREDFEEYDAGGLPDAWQEVHHQPPIPDCAVVEGLGRDGSKALRLTNAAGELPFVYRNLVRPLTRVRPGEGYVLSFWIRGRGVAQSGGIVGVCSDPWGNEAFTYSEPGELTGEWQRVTMPFAGPAGGRLNVIVRNRVALEEVLIDDVEVTRAR